MIEWNYFLKKTITNNTFHPCRIASFSRGNKCIQHLYSMLFQWVSIYMLGFLPSTIEYKKFHMINITGDGSILESGKLERNLLFAKTALNNIKLYFEATFCLY